jgi:outer membrane protein OmpA-like peptidoglycan-associated protein/tetratricopeptide (TPR) repeat protein
MRNIKGLLLLIFGVLALQAGAQSKWEKKGNKCYESFSYHQAVKNYLKVDEKSSDLLRKLAWSYYQTDSYRDSEKVWKELANRPDASGEDYYYYAQCLKVNKKYEEAYVWLKKASNKLTNDSRLNRSLGKYDQLQSYLKDEGRCVVKSLKMNTADQDFAPVLLGNQLVFASSRQGVESVQRKWNWNGLAFLELYAGELGPNDEVMNIKAFADVMKGKFHEGPISFNASGNIAMFTRNNYKERDANGYTCLELFEVRKDNNEWSEPMSMPFNNANFSVGHASLNNTGDMVYFVSDMPGGYGGTDVYCAKRNADGTWGKPMNLGTDINTEGNEMFPFIHESGQLFFASNGHLGLGGLDSYVAKPKGDHQWQVLNMGAPVNTNLDDFGFVMEADGKKGFFSSNRNGGKGSDDLYVVNILKPWQFDKEIKIALTNNLGAALDLAHLTFTDKKGKVIMVTTDSLGMAVINANDLEEVVIECNYPVHRALKTTKNLKPMEHQSVMALELEKIPEVSLKGLITEAVTGRKLSDVMVEMENLVTHEKVVLNTDAFGEFEKELSNVEWNQKVNYLFQFSKNGYLPQSCNYAQLIDREGEYVINNKCNVQLEKLEVGQDLGKLIDIKPIYFDLGKAIIRPDAEIELDKIVAVMNENPTMQIELGSHTDCRGSSESNRKLSDKRAKSSADYIKAKITNPNRINGRGYGEMFLVNQCECEGKNVIPCTEEQHQANRRTEFKIVKI